MTGSNERPTGRDGSEGRFNKQMDTSETFVPRQTDDQGNQTGRSVEDIESTPPDD